jgi:carboxylesterase type B
MDFIETQTTHGKIRGPREAGVNIFKGIPYAGQVSGQYRFRRPAELEPWSGVREALELGPPAMDISFKFNNQTPASPPDILAGSNPDRFIASHKMAELWTTFARTGVPAATDVPEWPAYTLDERATMRIDTECEVILDRFSQELAM